MRIYLKLFEAELAGAVLQSFELINSYLFGGKKIQFKWPLGLSTSGSEEAKKKKKKMPQGL